MPSRNGIVEICHKNVKRIAARKQCTIMQAVYWYNVMPKDYGLSSTASANMIHHYQVWLRGTDMVIPPTRDKE